MADLPNFDDFGWGVAIAAALRTGLLMELTKGPTTDRALAQGLGLDLRATSLVLDLLQTAGLVQREGDTVQAGERLVQAGRLPGGYAFTLGMWGHTEEFLRTGKPFMLMDRSAAEREHAYRDVVGVLAMMFEGQARQLAARLPLQPKRILDVGCGSGVWSLAIAELHADAHVTGLDLPAVLQNFKARAAALSLAERAHVMPGDMHEVEVPREAFDLVVIANVLRLETPERAASVVQRIARGVAPGGSLLVVDSIAAGTPERERARALYALHLGLRTLTGQVHRAETISGWLAQAGLPQVTAIDVADAAGALLATKN